jgi:Na+-driven multidrug efflux pump
MGYAKGNFGMSRTSTPGLFVEEVNGGENPFFADATWKCQIEKSRRVYNEGFGFAPLFYMEEYTADESDKNWKLAGYDDSAWMNAKPYNAMAIKSASIHLSKLFVNSFINSYGVAVSAFAGVANKVNSISNLISNSLNTAGSSMVGQNIGAKKYERVPRIAMVIAASTAVIATVLSVTVCLFPDAIFGIFIKEVEKEAVLRVGREYLPIAVLIFFGSACRAPANAILNGSGNYRVNFVTAILDGIILRIGLSVLFGIVLKMEYMGFWLGDALAGFTPMVIGIVFYLSGKWKDSKRAA